MKQRYVKRVLADGRVLPELGRVLSVDPRDQSARVLWLRQNREGEYKLSELKMER